jgi:hypothetical protein
MSRPGSSRDRVKELLKKATRSACSTSLESQFDDNGKDYMEYANNSRSYAAEENMPIPGSTTEQSFSVSDSYCQQLNVTTGIPEGDDTEVDMDPGDVLIDEFCKQNLHLSVAIVLKSPKKFPGFTHFTSECSNIPLNELKACLLQSLQDVIRSLKLPREDFGQIVRAYLSDVRRLMDNTVDWFWCIDNLMALLCLTYDTSPNFVESFDLGCGIFSEIAGRADKSNKVDEKLTTEVLTILLIKNSYITVFSQIAFEAILQILAKCRMNYDVLKKLCWPRMQINGFYSQRHAPLRCMRAEYLRVVLFNSVINTWLIEGQPEEIEEACIAEIQQTVLEEPSSTIQSKYFQILQQYGINFQSERQLQLEESKGLDDDEFRRRFEVAQMIENLQQNCKAKFSAGFK